MTPLRLLEHSFGVSDDAAATATTIRGGGSASPQPT
jgi:hypothetical protein